ncbi:4553_t:CDS:2 [Ambispora gerdemannii]|uniref:4553_t:CDS:1 n=1 Tax=Ambispora gerdemannii TaxID=144530 RepID=A0A9N9FGF5_9GLOM|nr:4553_t:CDS:2 [Ambispora gerdemannii]
MTFPFGTDQSQDADTKEKNANKPQSSSSHIDSYINDLNEYLGDFLQNSQPSYDPNVDIIKDEKTIQKELLKFKEERENSLKKDDNNDNSDRETKKNKYNFFSFDHSANSFNPNSFGSPDTTQKKLEEQQKLQQPQNETAIYDLEQQQQQPELDDKDKEIRYAQELAAGREITEQKKAISQGALLNCADLDWELRECFTRGTFWQRLTMCHEPRETFWKCVTRQKELLKELNYYAPSKSDQENQEILDKADSIAQEERLNAK